jgi:hypothetical protein
MNKIGKQIKIKHPIAPMSTMLMFNSIVSKSMPTTDQVKMAIVVDIFINILEVSKDWVKEDAQSIFSEDT